MTGPTSTTGSRQSPMPTVPLGRNGPMVSVLGLGTAAIGRPGYINEGHGLDFAGRTDHALMEAHAATMFDAAVEVGITYLDTARSYGDGEGFLGRWLDRRAAPTSATGTGIVVGSKWGYRYVADWEIDRDVHEIKDHSAEAFHRQWAETAERLGSDLTLYQIHSVTPDSPVLDDADVLTSLAHLKDTGVLIGLTTSGPDQPSIIRRALTVEADGRRLFDTVQATWNLLEPSAGPALQDAHDAGLGVIIKEAVANGRLTDRGDHALALGDPAWSTDAVALAAALAQPFSTVVLSGASTLEQLASNRNALGVPPEVLDRALVESIAPSDYWRQRSARPWT